MLNHPLDKLVFVDIETTSQYETFAHMPEELQAIFKRRYKTFFEGLDDNMSFEAKEDAIEEFYSRTAPLQPEWGRILCISIGTFTIKDKEYSFKVNEFFDEDESILLQKFNAATASITAGPIWKYHWVAHHGLAFDYPYIAKRIVYNKLPLPNLWDFGELKPWEIKHLIDTKIIIKWGVYDNAVSLEHLAYLFGVKSPKSDISGADVKDVYYQTKDLARISKYCSNDVKALAEIYLRIKGDQSEINFN